MTTETKPGERRKGHAPRTRRVLHRSDQPYSSILDEDVDLSAELPGSTIGRARAPRISREEVFSTADALLVEGVRPTIDRVRVRLGRGSPNTINDFMDLWWAKLGSRLRDLPGREFPQLPESVAMSVQRLWNEALEAAYDSLKAPLVRKVAKSDGLAGAFDADNAVLERDLQAKLAKAIADLDATRSELQDLRGRFGTCVVMRHEIEAKRPIGQVVTRKSLRPARKTRARTGQ